MLAAVEHFTGASIPWPTYAFIMMAFFACACFLAFRDQFLKVFTLEANLSNALALPKTCM